MNGTFSLDHNHQRHFIRVVILLLCLVQVDALDLLRDPSYEPLNYPRIKLPTRHSRAGEYRRPIRFFFSAFNRNFSLNLQPADRNSGLFPPDVNIEVNDQPENVDPYKDLYEGTVEGYPDSRVFGTIVDNLFDGTIRMGNGVVYTVEKVENYLSTGRLPAYPHSIIHSNEPMYWRKKRSPDNVVGNCGWSPEMMESHPVYEPDPELERPRPQRNLKNTDAKGRSLYRTCSMGIHVDQTFYRAIFKSDGKRNIQLTRNYILSHVAKALDTVNNIYSKTNFDGIKGIKFEIKSLKIYNDTNCKNGEPVGGTKNKLCNERLDTGTALARFSLEDYNEFCLVYAITYRDFEQNRLGLAHVGVDGIKATRGGVCDVYSIDGNDGQKRSLNTGIVTMVNAGARQTLRIFSLTLAHEIGHNFGAPHDNADGVTCKTEHHGKGSYIMHASANGNEEPNNNRFSDCSIQKMSAVLNHLLNLKPNMTKKTNPRNCFEEKLTPFCGNQRREGTEVCDCGMTEAECNDIGDVCCNSKGQNNPCQLKSGAKCSPGQGTCCDPEKCGFKEKGAPCREEEDCTLATMCEGDTYECPQAAPKQDGTACASSTMVCKQGSCSGSLCEKLGYKDCQLTKKDTPDLLKLCYLSCMVGGKCVSTLELKEFVANRTEYQQPGRLGQRGIILKNGDACNNKMGICDIFRRCRNVQSDGMLATLKEKINLNNLLAATSFLLDRWWIFVVAGVSFLLVLVFIVKCFAVHTSSSNPNKKPARKIKETISQISRRQKMKKTDQKTEGTDDNSSD